MGFHEADIELANTDQLGYLVYDAAKSARAVCGLAECSLEISTTPGKDQERSEPHPIAGAPDSVWTEPTTRYTASCRLDCLSPTFPGEVVVRVSRAITEDRYHDGAEARPDAAKIIAFPQKPKTGFSTETGRGKVLVNELQQEQIETLTGQKIEDFVVYVEEKQCGACAMKGCGLTVALRLILLNVTQRW